MYLDFGSLTLMYLDFGKLKFMSLPATQVVAQKGSKHEEASDPKFASVSGFRPTLL